MTDAISTILSQIRSHESRMRTSEPGLSNAIGPIGLPDSAATGTPGVAGFQQTLSNAMDRVSETQRTAGELQQAFELGDPRADLARVMVAMQNSQVAFRASVEVRNRFVQAYQDVMNMPI